MTSLESGTASGWRTRRAARVILVFLALGALVAPMAYVFSGFWSVTGRLAEQATSERDAARYLAPLTHLVAALSQVQSASVREQKPDLAALRQAVADVDRVDRRHGEGLGAGERWPKLRDAIGKLSDREVAGEAAFEAHSELTSQALGLAAKVGIASGLASDPEFDARETLLRLPETIVHSGRLADLAVIGDTADNGGIHAALHRVVAARDAIGEGLRRSEGSPVVGPDGFDALDAFAAALSDLVAGAARAARGGRVSPDALRDLSSAVRAAALPLADQMTDAFDSALRDRARDATNERIGGGVAMGVGIALAAALLWLSLPARAGQQEQLDPAQVADQPGEEFGPDPGQVAEGALVGSELIDARDLLSSEELLRVGRAVRAVRGVRDDASS